MCNSMIRKPTDALLRMILYADVISDRPIFVGVGVEKLSSIMPFIFWVQNSDDHMLEFKATNHLLF